MPGSLRSVASFDVNAWGESLFKPAPKTETGGNSNSGLPGRSGDSRRSTSTASTVSTVSTVSSLRTFDADEWKKKMERLFKPEKKLELDLNPILNSDTARTATPTREHQPGAARSKQLRDMIAADRGKKSRVYKYLPTDKGKFYREVKQWLKNEALACQLELLEMGSASDDEAIEKLQEMLTSRLKKRGDLSEQMADLAQKYIDKKYGGENGKLHFVATEDGGEFPSEGTNLDGPVIRTGTGTLYQLAARLTSDDRKQLLKQDYTGTAIVLGKGGTAEVLLARRLEENKKITFVAAKNFTNLHAADLELTNVSMVPFGKYGPEFLEPFRDKSKAYLFMELASYGNSLRAQERIERIADPDTRIIAERTLATHYVEAVRAFKGEDPQLDHQEQKPQRHHLDIKPDNFLVRSDGSIFLSDFATATTEDKFGLQPDYTQIKGGTDEYMDPLVRTMNASAANADKFSLGVTLYGLATGKFPTEDFPGPWRGCDAGHLDGSSLRGVAMKLMDKDPAERPSLDKVLELPYFKDGGKPKANLPDKEFGDLVKPEPATCRLS